MVKEAEEHAEDDKERRAEVEARNHAEGLVNQVEKSLSEHGDKVADEEKSGIESDVAGLKEALEGEDSALITEKSEALSMSSMKLGEAIYKAEQMAAEAGNENSDASMGSDDDGIVDADFEEVENEDDKKDQSSV